MAKLVMELGPAEMKKFKRPVMILLMGLFCMSNVSYAGNGDLTVGGALEMTGTANGFLPPRMATSDRGNLSPSPGMLIYNTDDNAYNYYTSSGWKILAAGLPVHDNTGASSDYALAVGETAKITYTNATSIPLHIATVDGAEYEIDISCVIVAAAANNTGLSVSGTSGAYEVDILYPNSTTTIAHLSLTGTTSSASFHIGDGSLRKAKLNICTKNGSWSYIGHSTANANNGYVANRTVCGSWATTVTYLGTIVHNSALSGIIIVRRLL